MSISEGVVKSGDAELFCRVSGNKTPLLLIHGAGVDSDSFIGTAEYLSENHKVITYDRRGYSRSSGGFSEDFFAQQAEDAAAVLKEYSGGEKADIVGCSAGAVIASKLASRFPELVGSLILHEPPAVELLSKGHPIFAWADRIRGFVEAGKPGRGISVLLSSFEEADERAEPKDDETLFREEKNLHVFMEHEFIPFFYKDSLPEIFGHIPITLCAGDGHKDSYLYESAEATAKRYGARLVHFPGFHNCAYELPLDFAVGIEGILSLEKYRKEN